MKKTKSQGYNGWLQANVPEPDYKWHKGWRRVVWRLVHFFDGWYGF
ncbi:hypothetical protein U8P71_17390 [Rhizobium ruizarguesonis]|nr:hypothetical protein U8P71_17390 [Rhizobium ruizarguesonis]